MAERLALGFGLAFEDLYRRDGLARLDGVFIEALKSRDVKLRNLLVGARGAPDELPARANPNSSLRWRLSSKISSASCSASRARSAT